MHDEVALKEFNLEEQKSKDLITAVKTIIPVISIIRKWGKRKRTCEYYQIENKIMYRRIEVIEHKMSSIDEDYVENIVIPEYEEMTARYKETCSIIKEYSHVLEQFESSVNKYKEYATLYSWITVKDVEKTLNLNTFSEDEILSLLFLILNNYNASLIYKDKSMIEMFEPITNFNVGLIFSSGIDFMIEKIKRGQL